jgi:hypothetical protein
MNCSPVVETTSIPKPHGNTGRPSRRPISPNSWLSSSSSTQSSLNPRQTTYFPNDRQYEGLYTPLGAAALSAAGGLSSQPRKISLMLILKPRMTTTIFKRAITLRIFRQIPRSITSGSWSYVSMRTLRPCMTRTSTTTIKCHLAFCHTHILNLSMSVPCDGGSHKRIVLHASWISSNICSNATRCLWTAYQKRLEVYRKS